MYNFLDQKKMHDSYKNDVAELTAYQIVNVVCDIADIISDILFFMQQNFKMPYF